jgi:histidinol-phosphate aminotransferase
MTIQQVLDLVRPVIARLQPYHSARHEFTGKAGVFLDANENPFGDSNPYHRYPDPLQNELKNAIEDWLKVSNQQIFLGNGSDEAIDLLLRVFCTPGQDNIVLHAPTYGMYKVAADVNDVAVHYVTLEENFALNAEAMLAKTDERTKIIFLCSPNNPSGNLLDKGQILTILKRFSGLVVIDEAYGDFHDKGSFIAELGSFSNLVVLKTFSKAFAMAGLRLGLAVADKRIIELLNKIKYPYNINAFTQQQALKALQNLPQFEYQINAVVSERQRLVKSLQGFAEVENVFPSEANFLLVQFTEAARVYSELQKIGIIVRDRSSQPGCHNCLRITVGTPEENNKLLNGLQKVIANAT